MSLSDKERLTGMYFAIYHMQNHAHNLKNDSSEYGYSRLITLVNHLWHNLLKKESNSAHWIVGSSATSIVNHDVSGVWGEAIRHVYNEAIYEKNELDSDFDVDANHFIAIDDLLSHYNTDYKDIYEIFAWSEQLAYYLRRYDDEFLKEFEDLSFTLSTIQGELFRLFIDDEAYAKAYALSRTLHHVYGITREDERDIVTKWLYAECIHHYLSRPMSVNGENLSWVVAIHQEISKAADAGTLTKQLRLMTAIRIAGRRLHYEHVHSKLLEMIAGDSDFDVDTIKAELEKCFKAHEKNKKKTRENHNEYAPKEYEM
jgi:hypothetical protein